MPEDPENAALAVELFVEDVRAAVRWYEEALGFKLMRMEELAEGHAVFAIGTLFEATIMFMYDAFYAGTRSDLDYRGSGIDVRIMAPDVDEVYERVRKSGAEIVHDIGDREYGLRDFIMRDPFGFRLRFAQALATA